ncbi:hypothetical protein E2C01_091619 [Portunus trituberculatus]|uniref:Uncharacterized protein n=1 Tax=Portunus trituberculatus TaxID=210409 RepID=A0A5B7JJH7_PORTR|nr:hypothetical protein [Portunus trituberculatus]
MFKWEFNNISILSTEETLENRLIIFVTFKNSGDYFWYAYPRRCLVSLDANPSFQSLGTL